MDKILQASYGDKGQRELNARRPDRAEAARIQDAWKDKQAQLRRQEVTGCRWQPMRSDGWACSMRLGMLHKQLLSWHMGTAAGRIMFNPAGLAPCLMGQRGMRLSPPVSALSSGAAPTALQQPPVLEPQGTWWGHAPAKAVGSPSVKAQSAL